MNLSSGIKRLNTPDDNWNDAQARYIKNDTLIRSLVKSCLSDPSSKSQTRMLTLAINDAKRFSDEMDEALRNIEREKKLMQPSLRWFAHG